VHNENSEGEGSEADVMITSEVEDHRLRLSNTRPQRETVNDSSDDDDDEAVDPGARAARGMYHRGQTHIGGEDDDEDEEDEVHADVASVPASVDGDGDIVDEEITPHQFRTSTSRSPHLDGGPGNNNAGTTANNQQRLRAGVRQVQVRTAAGGDHGVRAASSSGSAGGEGMMTLDDFSDEDAEEDGDFDPIARAYVPSGFGDDVLHINGEEEDEGGVDELGGLGPQGSRGGSRSNNVTMVAGAGEKRKRRTVAS